MVVADVLAAVAAVADVPAAAGVVEAAYRHRGN